MDSAIQCIIGKSRAPKKELGEVGISEYRFTVVQRWDKANYRLSLEVGSESWMPVRLKQRCCGSYKVLVGGYIVPNGLKSAALG